MDIKDLQDLVSAGVKVNALNGIPFKVIMGTPEEIESIIKALNGSREKVEVPEGVIKQFEEAIREVEKREQEKAQNSDSHCTCGCCEENDDEYEAGYDEGFEDGYNERDSEITINSEATDEDCNSFPLGYAQGFKEGFLAGLNHGK